jgi:hypothetical protein
MWRIADHTLLEVSVPDSSLTTLNLQISVPDSSLTTPPNPPLHKGGKVLVCQGVRNADVSMGWWPCAYLAITPSCSLIVLRAVTGIAARGRRRSSLSRCITT